jgi:hypothetical protein
MMIAMAAAFAAAWMAWETWPLGVLSWLFVELKFLVRKRRRHAKSLPYGFEFRL